MKLKNLLLLLLIVTAGFVGGYFYQTNRKNNNDLPHANKPKPTLTPEQEFTYLHTTYYAVVTGIKNKKNNVTQEEFGLSTPIYTIKGKATYFDQLSPKIESYTTEVESIDELVTKLNSEPNKLGMIPFDYLNFKIKLLSVDNIFPFDKKADLSKYPYKKVEELKSKTRMNDTSNLESSKIVKIGHTGSMIPARGVQHWTEKKFNNDYTHIFKPTKPLFDSFDHLSSTFEISLKGEGVRCDKCMSFVGPEKFMEGVKYSGIDLFTMASNHIMDGGVDGLANTQKLLNDAGIEYTGASTKNNDDAGKPVLVDVNGLKIAYLGFNDTPGYEQWAKDNKPGAASISDVEWNTTTGVTSKYEPNEERIKGFIKRAKDLNPDLVVILMHWGSKEYVAEKLPYQKTLADLLLKHGADIILGDHVHWVQEIEFNGEKPVFYGVGNYIFDQMWSTETQQGMTIELNFYDKKLVNFRLHPHQLYLYDRGTVELLKPEQKEYQQVIDRVMNASTFD